ncbi:MAG: regulatory protein RecX [Bacillota bacterium]|nr:regulatory protein RecX [Bacillota bacterium]
MDDSNNLKKARSRALRYLTYRARTLKELKEYLLRKDYAPDLISQVVSEMIEYGYIDDSRFAEDYITYRKPRGYGRNRVRHELGLKGIDREVIDEKIADSFCYEDDLSIIKNMLERRYPAEGKIDEKWISRQVGFLRRRGYQDSLIIEAIRDYKLSD